ncbi:MAG: hypothetical protein AMXMBFR78_33720 [Rubrivivax sp.]
MTRPPSTSSPPPTPRRRGRPPTGTALTGAQRQAAARARKRALVEETGGRVLYDVPITAAAAEALERLRDGGRLSVAEVVCAALVRAARG